MPNSEAQINGSGPELIKATEQGGQIDPTNLFAIIGQKETEIMALRRQLVQKDLAIEALKKK